MAIDEGVPIQDLALMHIDMCPVNQAGAPVWLAASVGDSGSWNDTPECRAELSAIFHGVGDAHFAQSDRGVAHYPDTFVCNLDELYETFCGDGVCGEDETCDTCREDCSRDELLCFDSTYNFGPLTIETSFTDFGVYGAESVRVNDRAKIRTDDIYIEDYAPVGSGGWQPPGNSGYIELGVGAHTGKLDSGGRIFIRGGEVAGRTYAKDNVEAQAGSVFLDSIHCGGAYMGPTAPAPPYVFCPYEFPTQYFRDSAPQYVAWDMQASGFQNYSNSYVNYIPERYSMTLYPNETFRGEEVYVRQGGTIMLKSGVYYFSYLRLEHDATLYLNTDVNNTAVFIFVDGDVSFWSGANVVAPDPTRFMLVSRGSVYMGPEVDWNGGTIISNDQLNIDRNPAGILGMFYGKNVEIHQDTQVRFKPFGLPGDIDGTRQLYLDALAASEIENPDPNPDTDMDTDTGGDTDTYEEVDTDTEPQPAPPDSDPIVFDGASGEVVTVDLTASGGEVWLYTDTWPGYDDAYWDANVCIAVQGVNGQPSPAVTVNVTTSDQSLSLAIDAGWYSQSDIPDTGPYTLQVLGDAGAFGIGLCNY